SCCDLYSKSRCCSASHRWSFIEGRSSAFHLFQDIRGLGCPDKRFGFLVVLLDGNHDRGDEFFNAVKHASADAVVGEISKKTFHHVEPGSAGRCEVHVEARMALEPALHSRVLVRRVVVSNEMQLLVSQGLLINPTQEF